MSTTSNLKLNKHDNVSTNTNPFDIENYLNVNWDKIDKYAGNSNSTILKLQEENARLKKTIQTELEERTIEAESIEVNDSAEANCEIDLQGNTTQETTTGKNALNIFSRYQVGQKTSINGIDFVVNKDGSVTANGTATDDAAFIIVTNSNLGQDAFNGTYILNGCPTGGSLQSYRHTFWIEGDKTYSDFGNGVQFTKSKNGNWNSTIIIYKGTKVANLIFKPMIRLATITDDTFEKYTGGEASPNPDYPSKVETVGSNINLLNLQNGTKGHNGITVKTNNGIISSNGTASSNSFNTIYLEEPITLKANQTYVLSANNESTIGATNTSSNYASLRLQYNSTPINNTDAILGNKNAFKSFTFTEDILVDSIVVRTGQGLTMNNFIIKPKLEQSKTSSPYSPYGKGSVEVKVSNKNLFTTANQISAYIGGSSFVLGDSSTSKDNYTAIIPIKPNTSYTISRSIISSRFRAGFYSTKNALGQTLRNGRTSDSATNMTVTSGENDYYLYLYYWTKNDTTSAEEIASTIQIEKGSQATDFIPHKQQTYPLFLPFELCKIGEYKDCIFKENNKWYKHKEIGKIVFDGTRTGWGFGSSDTASINVANINIPSMKSSNFGLGFCDYFLKSTSKELNTLRFGANDTQFWFYVDATKFTNINDWKTWLSNNNITVYYVLATPIDEEITDTTLIQQLNELENTMSYYGTTYVYTTNEVIKPILKFTYNRSNRLRIENLEKAIINS